MNRFLDVLLSFALIAGIGGGCYYLSSTGKPIDQNLDPEQIPETTQAPEPFLIEQDNQDMFRGDLILVNQDAEFHGFDEIEEQLEVLLTQKQDCRSFTVTDADVKVLPNAGEHLIQLFNAFFEVEFDDNIIVRKGFRTLEQQKNLYEKYGGDGGNVAKPGHSDMHTGLCVELDVSGSDFDGTGIYSYIPEHCGEYGLILRYPETKEEITGMAASPCYYRYVGTPHAEYIMQNGLCLEEYIALLYQYTYDGEHLKMTDHDGKVYEIYYYPADLSQDHTSIPVPEDLIYHISGNNIDGFIITVETGEVEEITEPETEELTETAMQA